LAWTIEYDTKAKAQLKRLDKATTKRLMDFLENEMIIYCCKTLAWGD